MNVDCLQSIRHFLYCRDTSEWYLGSVKDCIVHLWIRLKLPLQRLIKSTTALNMFVKPKQYLYSGHISNCDHDIILDINIV